MKIDNVGIAVTDIESARRWFTECMGFGVADSGEGWALVELEEGHLYVFETGTKKQGPTRRSVLDGNEPGLDHISWRVPSVDAKHAELAARGVEFVEGPVSKPDWGLRVAAFVDPDRNLYFLIESL
jgi:catechol 2,3-dioxygenase-like lactoylglutathione lyase family enzyme